jgi:DNA-binding transcriptional LysR family regulator
LAVETSISVAELDGESFVGFDSDLSIRRATDRFLRQHDVHVRVALEFDNIENIKRAVEIASGVAILPRASLLGELHGGTLLAIPFRDGRLVRPLAIVHRRSEPLGLTAARFLRLLQTGAESSTSAATPTATATAAKDTTASAAPAAKEARP